MGDPIPAESGELGAVRTIPRATSLVWRAATTPSSIERWWAPAGIRASVRRFDLRPGGAVVLHLRHLPVLLTGTEGRPTPAVGVPLAFVLRGEVAAVEPERTLDLRLALEIDRRTPPVNASLRFDFEAEGAATRVSLRTAGHPSTSGPTVVGAGLGAQLERLEAVTLAGVSDRPRSGGT